MVNENAIAEQQIRALLIEQKSEIESLMAASTQDAAPVALDQTQQGRLSRMDALQRQAMAAETQRRRARKLQMIDAALKRLETGDYGYCVSCGEAIEAQRLALDPAVASCLEHAK